MCYMQYICMEHQNTFYLQEIHNIQEYMTLNEDGTFNNFTSHIFVLVWLIYFA